MGRQKSSAGWDPVATWYAGWVGAGGSDHHRGAAIPAVVELLEIEAGDRVLDVGCGPGVLAPHVASAGGAYTGVDVSPRMVSIARRRHARHGSFLQADATSGEFPKLLDGRRFHAVTFLLSIQDIDPAEAAIRNASELLRPGGSVVLLMTHPCFRVPRQSGWGWDERRKLRFRRIDRYLSPLAVPVKSFGKKVRGSTWSHHRPLHVYADALATAGLTIDRLLEIPTPVKTSDPSERRANAEIPLFLGVRAIRR